MVGRYAREQGYGYMAKKNWPITLLALIVVSFVAMAMFALVIGFQEIAGILVAFMIVMLVVTILFVTVPVYMLDLLD